jgi:hypothetical protein
MKPAALCTNRSGMHTFPHPNQEEVHTEPLGIEPFKRDQPGQPRFHCLTVEIFNYVQNSNHLK